ncbi:MAG: hypothetical protein QW063_02600, partial [Candidatus Nanoarchaeia archaeon]
MSLEEKIKRTIAWVEEKRKEMGLLDRVKEFYQSPIQAFKHACQDFKEFLQYAQEEETKPETSEIGRYQRIKNYLLSKFKGKTSKETTKPETSESWYQGVKNYLSNLGTNIKKYGSKLFKRGPEKSEGATLLPSITPKKSKKDYEEVLLPSPTPAPGAATGSTTPTKPGAVAFVPPDYSLENIIGRPVTQVPQPGYLLNLYNAGFNLDLQLNRSVYDYKHICKELASDLVGFIGRLCGDWSYCDKGATITATYDLGSAAWYDKYGRKLEVTID